MSESQDDYSQVFNRQSSSSGVDSDCSDSDNSDVDDSDPQLPVREVLDALSSIYRRTITLQDIYKMCAENTEELCACIQVSKL